MLEKVEINDAAAVELLKSAEVRAELEARAQRIAAAAGEGFEVTSGATPTRARVSVGTATFKARKAEATDRVLLHALDAGRG